jgi:hypothetical protein
LKASKSLTRSKACAAKSYPTADVGFADHEEVAPAVGLMQPDKLVFSPAGFAPEV